ncbi:hypothetical protein [Kutzneria kofuensis]|uniref:Putative membrane protein n=1 Tax=Kutzneria kofuensis TaxID=103725 RepID=A0A7W9KAB0_9PSEU|nr:hypothetical protein [Kutzneria kofuensis]MBB5888835.1 putative membrane protein [Kutzneria kofuensis]
MNTLRRTACVLMAVAACTALSVLIGVPGQWRLALTVLFALTVPGWAIAAYVRPWRQSYVWTVAVAVSLALSILLSQAMLSLGYWHPERALLVFALASMIPLGHHIVRGVR